MKFNKTMKERINEESIFKEIFTAMILLIKIFFNLFGLVFLIFLIIEATRSLIGNIL